MLDLGSIIGSVLAALAAGPAIHVIGVDMTPVQLAEASRLAVEGGLVNAEFCAGHTENSP
ncbi:methyltransferase domain-containing protein [Amycolatopsis sp. NPDC004625]|uniref:methyltransferase domain-containing protein n=1 Tax=Amycolatopsis sp. NPDC004625 TaxID=3154670 RepID=UPI0033B11294